KEWAKAIEDEVGNIPVVFENSYRNAPMYSFYTNGTPTFSLNNFMYRKNQYSINDTEEQVRGKDVAYVSKYLNNPAFTYTREDGGLYKGKYISNFQSYRKLDCIIEDDEVKLHTDKAIDLKVYNPYKEDIDLKKLKFAVTYMDNYKHPLETLRISPETLLNDITTLKKQDTTVFKFQLPKTKTENIGYFRVVISENDLLYGLNGKPIPVK
ncbi:MAG: 4-amino-4-deoxy-L-arabinose transferase, partial [Maribacter dokdonensis]